MKQALNRVDAIIDTTNRVCDRNKVTPMKCKNCGKEIARDFLGWVHRHTDLYRCVAGPAADPQLYAEPELPNEQEESQ